MIRINLFGEKEDRTGIHAIQLLTFVGTVVVGVLTCFFIYSSTAQQLELKREEHAQLTQQLTKLKEKTAEVDDLDKKRKTLKEKLSTIALLKAKKHGPVHVVSEITRTIPERAWLTAANEKSGQITLEGVALDNQTVAQFMDQLDKSEYFEGVNLLFSKEYTYKGAKLAQFSLSAKLEDPLKIQRDRAATHSETSQPQDAQ